MTKENGKKRKKKKPQKLPCDEFDIVRPLPRSLNVLEMANASVRDVTLSIPSSMSNGWLMVIGDDETVDFSISAGSRAGGALNVTNQTVKNFEKYSFTNKHDCDLSTGRWGRTGGSL